jgi:hypothetical protein
MAAERHLTAGCTLAFVRSARNTGQPNSNISTKTMIEPTAAIGSPAE